MELFYREFGEGVPFIIVHGLYGSSDNWISIARVLSEDFRLILPDLRNHGSSPHSDIHTYEAMASDIIELADSLGIDRFFIAGHSMGGKVAIEVASRDRSRILGLAVIDISPFTPLQQENEIAAFHRMVLHTLNSIDPVRIESRQAAEDLMKEKISSGRIVQFLLKNLARESSGGFRWKLNSAVLAENLGIITAGYDRNSEGYEPFRGFPVLFIRAANSGYIPDVDFKPITRLFPAAEIVTIDGASHWVHADEPERVISLLRSLAE